MLLQILIFRMFFFFAMQRPFTFPQWFDLQICTIHVWYACSAELCRHEVTCLVLQKEHVFILHMVWASISSNLSKPCAGKYQTQCFRSFNSTRWKSSHCPRSTILLYISSWGISLHLLLLEEGLDAKPQNHTFVGVRKKWIIEICIFLFCNESV